MDKFLAVLQLFLAFTLAIVVGVTLHNLWNIATRPETISVVNTIIGQGVLIVCLSASARLLFRRGLRRLRAGRAGKGEKEI